MLEIRNLSKSYGEKKAVCNLNLIVEDGDIMGFIGKNGAGKTTTLKSCLGIVGIDKGEILLDGVSILKEPIVCKKKMAYVYLTNTACGFLFAAIFVVLIVFMTDKISLYAYQLAEYLKVAPAEYDVFYIFVFTVLVTLSSTTYPSISIEGKQIEILKSLPITAKYIIKSKILLHLSVSGPIILVLNTVMAFYLHWSLEKVMLGYAMPFLYSLFIGIIGCLINIFFPNFEWENITHIIKQSLPAILSALIGTLSTCGTCYLLLKYFSNSLLLGGYIVCGIILLLISILVLCLNRRGEHLYQAL